MPRAEATYPGRSGQIAFAEPDRSGNYVLSAMSTKTGRIRRLTRSPRGCRRRTDNWIDEQPSYSASGRWIVYRHFDDCFGPMASGIYRMRSNGTGHRLLVAESPRSLPGRGRTFLDWPSLSPSGRLLAWGAVSGYQGQFGKVYVAPISRLRKRVRLHGTRVFHPAWSANGRLLASAPTGITEFETSGSVRSVLTRAKGLAPDWSPDGRSLAYYLESEEGQGVYVVGAGGSGIRRFADQDDEHPVWAPGGGQIAFIRNPGLQGVGFLYVKPVGGGKGRLLRRNVGSGRISWQALR